MNVSMDWNRRRELFERNLRKTSPDYALDDVAGPAIVTIEIDYTEKQLDRLGYLRCARPKIGFVQQVLHLGTHRATVKLNEEKTVSLARLWSSRAVQDIRYHIFAQLKAGLNNRDFEKIRRILGSQLTVEKRFSEISAQSMAAEIRSRMETVEPLHLDAHANEGRDLTIPYGAELTVTTKGVLKIVRRFSINRRKKTVRWRDGFDVSVLLNIDTSLDLAVNTNEISVRSFQPADFPEIEEKKQSAARVELPASIAEPMQNHQHQKKIQTPVPQDLLPDLEAFPPVGGVQSEPLIIQPIKSISDGANQLVRFRKEEERQKHHLLETVSNALNSIDEPLSITPNLLGGPDMQVKEAHISSKGIIEMTLNDGKNITTKLRDLEVRTALKVFDDILPKIRSKKAITT